MVAGLNPVVQTMTVVKMVKKLILELELHSCNLVLVV